MIDIKAYFRRIGLPEDITVEPTGEFLSRLQYQHVISVPYENLDIMAHRPLSLAIPAHTAMREWGAIHIKNTVR